ncbi:MAG: hypothetical protein DWQ05_19635 [Calditrichaeota bacterium]|nr:MAG: hypothetical protein DWQ05_19635 [Calditrichota bacterium]
MIPLQNPPHLNSINKLDPASYSEIAKDFLQKNNLTTNKARDIEQLGEVLREFLRIPYENLSKILKFNKSHQDATAIRMPDEVWEDFQQHRLGGTCFSLTFFLQCIAHFLGYACYPVMARMKIGPNHHCALVVIWNGQHFLADPGYVLDVPMAFASGQNLHYRNAHTAVEIALAERKLHYSLCTITRGIKQWRYEFCDLPTPPDIFFQHWIGSFSWNGMNELCLSRNEKDSLIYVRKFHMRHTSIHGKKNFNLKQNRAQQIHESFGIPEKIVITAEEALRENRARTFRGGENG